MFTLLTTRNSRESNAVVKTATLIHVTLQNHFVFFTWKAQGTWYLLLFNFSKNLPTLTQYGPLTIHIVIGCWQKCGFATLTIKYIRSVIEKTGYMSNMQVIFKQTFAFYYMVRVTYQLHSAFAINCSVTRQFTFSSLNSKSGDIASILCTLFRKLSLNVWFIILKCVIKRVWLFHLYHEPIIRSCLNILWPNSFPNEEKKKQGKEASVKHRSATTGIILLALLFTVIHWIERSLRLPNHSLCRRCFVPINNRAYW